LLCYLNPAPPFTPSPRHPRSRRL